jgi:hypothetical protein
MTMPAMIVRLRCSACAARFRFYGVPPRDDTHTQMPATEDRLGATLYLPIVPLTPRETVMLEAVEPWPKAPPPEEQPAFTEDA